MSANAPVRLKCTFRAIVNTQQQQQCEHWQLQKRNRCRLALFHRWSNSREKYYAKIFYRQCCQSLTRAHAASLCPLYLPIRCYGYEVSSSLTDWEQRNTNAENIALSNKIEREKAELATSLAAEVTHSSQLIETSMHTLVHNMTAQENKTNVNEFTNYTDQMFHNKNKYAKTTESMCWLEEFHTTTDKAKIECIDVAQARSSDREDAFVCKEGNAKLIKQKHNVSRNCEEKLSLSAALFGFTDMRTSVVTHISAAERITKEMPLLETWVKEELFVESNWVNICKEYKSEWAKLHDSNALNINTNGNEESTNNADAHTNNINIDVRINDTDYKNNCNINNVNESADAKEDICVANNVHNSHSIANELLNDTQMFVNIIGRPKLLRILLLRYLSHPCLWRDSVDEILQLAMQTLAGNFEGVDDEDNNNNDDKNVRTNKEVKDFISMNEKHDVYVSQLIDSVKTYLTNYLNQPVHKFNFYTPSLFDKLASFLSIEQIKFCETNALWDAFVIYNRADTSMLLSPQRPPFSFGELHPTIAREDLHMVKLRSDSNSCFADNTTVQKVKTSSELATSSPASSWSQVSNIDSTCASSHNIATITQTNNMNESSNGSSCSNTNDEKNNTHDDTMSESLSSSDTDLSHKQNTIESESGGSCNNSNSNIKNIVNDASTITITSTTTSANKNNLAHTCSAESWEKLNEYKQNEILFGKAAAELSVKIRPQNGVYVVHYNNTSSSDEYGSCESAADTDDNSGTTTSATAADVSIAAEVQAKDTCANDIHDVEHVTDIALHKMSDALELSAESAIRSNQDQNLIATLETLHAINLSTNGHEFTSQTNEIDCTSLQGVKSNTTNEHTKNANTLYELNTELVKDDSENSSDQSIEKANAQVRASNEQDCNNNKISYDKETNNNEETKQNRNIDYRIKSTLLSSKSDNICNSANTLEQSVKEHDEWASANHLYDIDGLLSSIIERYIDTECSEANNSENASLPADIVAPAFMQSNVSICNSHGEVVDKSYSTQTSITKLQKQVNLKYSEHQVQKVIGWSLSENATNGKTNKTNTGVSKKRRQRALRELYYTNAHISNSGEQGEVEDLHLSKLWDAFTKTELSELISIYYDVHHRFDAVKKEICIELLAQSILLLLFFARDEVRAITAPDKTYYQLWYLHAEICKQIQFLSRTCDDVFTRERCNEYTEHFMLLQESQKEQQEQERQEHYSEKNENQEAKHAKYQAPIRWSTPHFESLPYEVQLSYTCFGISHLLGKHTPLSHEQSETNITQSENSITLQWQKWENEQESTLQEEVLSKEAIPLAELSEQPESKSVSPFSLFCSLLKIYECKKLTIWQKNEELYDNDICDDNNERICNTISQLSKEESHKWFDSLTTVQRKAIEFCFHDANAINAEEQESKQLIAKHNTCKASQPKSSLKLAENIATISLLPSSHEHLHSDKECQTQSTEVDAVEEDEKREGELEENSEPSQEEVQREEYMEQINNDNLTKCIETNEELLQYKEGLQTKLKHNVFALVRDVLYNLLQSSINKISIKNTEQEESKITSDSVVCLNAYDNEYNTDIHDLMTCLNSLARVSPELQNTSISQQINYKILFDIISTVYSKHIHPLITPLLEELNSELLEQQQLLEGKKELECKETESCKSNIDANSFAKDVRKKRKYTKKNPHIDKLHEMKEVRRTKREIKESKRQLHQQKYKLSREEQEYDALQLQEETSTENHEWVKHQERRKGLRKRKESIESEYSSLLPPEQQQQLESREEKLQHRRSAHCKVKRQSKKLTECNKVWHNTKNKLSRQSAQSALESELELEPTQITTTTAPSIRNRRQRTRGDSENVNSFAKTHSRRRKGVSADNRNVDKELSLVVLKPKRQYRRREKIIDETLNEAQISNNLSATFSAKENTSHHHHHDLHLREDESANINIEHNLDAQEVDDYQEIRL